MDNTQQPPAEVLDRIEQEAKQFAFYNYCNSVINNEAKFEDVNTWPYFAQVSYYTIKNYMGVNGTCWPYKELTLPIEYASKLHYSEENNKVNLQEITNISNQLRENDDNLKEALKEIESLTNQLKNHGNISNENMKLLRQENEDKDLLIEMYNTRHNKARTLLQKFISRHEAGLLPDRFIYDEIKQFLDGKTA
jgi:hypothetical protein